jgi:quinol monooxygenase YgiN
MYARVVTNKLQSGKADDWLDLLRDAVVPSLKEQRGFHGFVAVVDRASDRSIGYSVWETQEDMIASETSGNYPRADCQTRIRPGRSTESRRLRAGCPRITPALSWRPERRRLVGSVPGKSGYSGDRLASEPGKRQRNHSSSRIESPFDVSNRARLALSPLSARGHRAEWRDNAGPSTGGLGRSDRGIW